MTLRMAQEYAAALPQDGEKRPVKEWKNMIRALGDVNVGAIEQYKDVKERFTFLTAQREDILEAEEKAAPDYFRAFGSDGKAIPGAVRVDF